MARAEPVDGHDFVTTWNALEETDRKRIRRLVRIGRPQASQQDARLAVRYAAFVRTRFWWRTFWLWFVPGAVAALLVAATIHPVAIGVVGASAVQAGLTRRNTGRADAVNASLLG